MSTGHHPNTIYREQIGSTKPYQTEVYSSGTRAQFQSDAELEMKSGSTANFESGAVLNIQSGAKLYNKNINAYSSAATITNDGVTVISATANGVYTMAVPVLGAEKTIIVNSTATVKIKGSSDDSVRFATTKGGTVLTVVAPATDISVEDDYGRNIRLIGASTKLWYMAGFTSTSVITVSTAT